jgi:hypothetical protein
MQPIALATAAAALLLAATASAGPDVTQFVRDLHLAERSLGRAIDSADANTIRRVAAGQRADLSRLIGSSPKGLPPMCGAAANALYNIAISLAEPKEGQKTRPWTAMFFDSIDKCEQSVGRRQARQFTH